MSKIENYDLLAFFSPIGINALLENFPTFKQGSTVIAAFGNSTAEAVKQAGLKLDIIAPTPEHPSMVAAIDSYMIAQAKAAK
ncbi:hypothetical protein FACS1894201_11070 [Bacteroidia bacterium]|nr:hypothetical protein FACS1894201_11070 [Bacteroidia bacterium]